MKFLVKILPTPQPILKTIPIDHDIDLPEGIPLKYLKLALELLVYCRYSPGSPANLLLVPLVLRELLFEFCESHDCLVLIYNVLMYLSNFRTCYF